MPASTAKKKAPLRSACKACAGDGKVDNPSADEPRGRSARKKCERCGGTGEEPQHMHAAGRGCCPHPECVAGSSPKPRPEPRQPKDMTNEELVESQRQIQVELEERKEAARKLENSKLGKLAKALKETPDLLDVLAPDHIEQTDTSWCADHETRNGITGRRARPNCARCLLLDLIRDKAPLGDVRFVVRLQIASLP